MSRILLCALTGFFVLTTGLPTDAQVAPDLMFHHTSPHAFVSAVRRDSRGFAWISTQANLFRFDGINLVAYGTKEGLYDANIQSPVFEDGDGNLWFCSMGAIHCYHRHTGSIRYFFLHQPNSKAEIQEGYKIFFLNASGRLLIKADRKLYWFDTRIASKYLTGEGNPPEEVEHFIGQFTYTHFIPLPQGIGGQSGYCAAYSYQRDFIGVDICRISDTSLTIEYKLLKGRGSEAPVKIYHAAQDNDGSLWLASNQGLVHFDATLTKSNIISDYKDVRHLALWPPARLWVATKENGLLLCDTENDRYLGRYLHDPSNARSVSDNNIQAVHLDADDNLWLAIWTVGLDYTNLRKRKFDNFPVPPMSPDIKSGRFVPEHLAEDEDGGIWCASRRDGLIRLNPQSKQTEYFQKIKGGVIQTLPIDKKQVLVSTLDNGLLCYDRTNQTWAKVEGAPLPAAFMLKTSLGQIIVGGAFEAGIWEVYRVGVRWKAVPVKNEALSSKYWGMFYEDSLHRRYADSGSGLDIFDAQFNLLRPSIPFAGEIKAFAENERTVWAGGDFGLLAIDKQTLEPSFSGEKEGFPDLGVNGLLYREKNDTPFLWVSSIRGLFKYDLTNKTASFYELTDGLQSFSFSPHSGLQAHDGRFWFGGSKGLNVFFPDKIHDTHILAHPHVTKLTVNDSIWRTKADVTELVEILLNHDQNDIALAIGAVEFSDPMHNSLCYRIDKSSGIWLDALFQFLRSALGWTVPTPEYWEPFNNPQGLLPLPKLAPGKYQLRLRAANSDNEWNLRERVLNITITPPFWQTFWFFLLVLSSLGGVIFTYYRYRLGAVRKEEAAKREHQRQLAELDMKALRAQMKTHFVFNALESIKHYIRQANKESAINYLNICARLAREVLDNSSHPTIPLRRELNMLQKFVSIQTMGWEHTILYEESTDEKTIDTEQVMIPGLLLQPFVENAIKHGLKEKEGEKRLRLDIRRDAQGVLCCSVTDNGVGRKKAQETKPPDHDGSHAIQITKDRLKLYDIQHGTVSSIEITDLYDNQTQAATGTKVEIKLGTPFRQKMRPFLTH